MVSKSSGQTTTDGQRLDDRSIASPRTGGLRRSNWGKRIQWDWPKFWPDRQSRCFERKIVAYYPTRQSVRAAHAWQADAKPAVFPEWPAELHGGNLQDQRPCN